MEQFYHVFVYGTLRKGGTNHHILRNSECIQTQQIINGYQLYDFEQWYPYMIRGSEDEQVVGEIYKVNSAVKRELDLLEDIENDLYKFTFLHQYDCYTYIKYDEDVANMPKISSGDWIRYIQTQRNI